MKNPMALEMAHALESLAVVDETGLMHLGYSDSYAEVLGCSVDEAEYLMDEGFDILISEGKVTEVDGDYYMTEDLEEWKEQQREELEDWKNYQHDMMASYHQNIWGTTAYGYASV